jgi:histo-blood group ABO system transferase
MFWKAIFVSFLFTCLNADNIGLLIVATGKYIQFVSPLIESAERHFLKNHKVTYFIFTDQEPGSHPNAVYVYQKRLGWPFDTMHRYHIYYQNRELFKGQDYLFATDADMRFVGDIGDEILGERVATLHPGFIGQRGSYETNPHSSACIGAGEGKYYFAGGFYGGSRDAFLHILRTNIHRIESDLDRSIIAVWHDESHWNRYCIDYPPTVILSPSYCYPESWNLPYPKKLLALDKDHAKFRE